MNESIITLLRGTRTALQIAAEPIDWAARFLNNKRNYPPLWLRQHVGDPSYFEGSCGEYVAYLKLLCGLKPGDELLDIGCGCGLILMDTTGAGSLLDYIRPGNYVGMDIDKRSISWCKRYIKATNCFFTHLENRNGEHLPAASSSFSIVLAKSLFTHLLLDEAIDYLKEIKRLLKPRGECLCTWFLLRGQELKGKYTFKYKNVVTAYERETRPRLAVAYQEDWLLKKIKEVGLEIELPIRYGTWSGRQDGLSFQDIIIMRIK